MAQLFQLFATPWTVAYQALPPMGFSRQEYWSGLPFPSPGDLPNPGIESRFPTLQIDPLPSESPGRATMMDYCLVIKRSKLVYMCNNTDKLQKDFCWLKETSLKTSHICSIYMKLSKKRKLWRWKISDCQKLGVGGEYDYKGWCDNFEGMMETFCILIVVVTLIYMCVKIHS